MKSPHHWSCKSLRLVLTTSSVLLLHHAAPSPLVGFMYSQFGISPVAYLPKPLPRKLNTTEDKNHSIMYTGVTRIGGSEAQMVCKEECKSTHYVWPILSSLLLKFTILLNIHPNPMLSQNNLFSNFYNKIEAIRQLPLKSSSTLLHYQMLYINPEPYPLYHIRHPITALYTTL